jgi:hypothetical protein
MIAHMTAASSWMRQGLVDAKRTPTSIYAKIGVFGTYSEGAVIEQVSGGSGLRRYAAVVLGAADYTVLDRAIVNLDIISAGNVRVPRPAARP